MDFSQDVDVSNGPSGGMKPGNIDERKLFIGGLTFKVTEDELKAHFSKFGPVLNVNIKCDPITGRFRGFAFIVYSSPDSVEKALACQDHLINGKKIEPRRAKSRPAKIFVGGIPPEVSDEDIKAYFGQFGNITGIDLPFDKEKGQRKNFCFVTFDNEYVANDLLKKPKQTIKGHMVDVKKATPKLDPLFAAAAGPMMAGPGGMMAPPVPGMRNGRAAAAAAAAAAGGYMGAGAQWPAAPPAAAGAFGGYGDYSSGYGYDGGYDYYNGYEGGYEYGAAATGGAGAGGYGPAAAAAGGAVGAYGRPMGGIPAGMGPVGAPGATAALRGKMVAGKMRGVVGAAGVKPMGARGARHAPY